MKKISILALSAAFAVAAYAAADASAPSPELLKDKSLFSKVELFDSPVIFMNPKANADAIAAYEANKAGYSDNELLPVALCYMNSNNFAAADSLLDIFLKANPDNVRGLKGKATVSLLLNKPDLAIDILGKIYDKGDKSTLKTLCQTLVLTNKIDSLSKYMADIKQMAKTDLDYALFAMIYALRDMKNVDDAMISETLKNIDVKTALPKASNSTLENIFKVYSIKANLFPANTLVIPARAATNVSLWVPAKLIYEKALAADPKDTFALRGYALVQYRTGDIAKAASLLRQAVEYGDKEGASDAAELFILSGSDLVWKEFEKDFPTTAIKPLVRYAMVQISDRKDNADMFFIALSGENSDALYKDANVRKTVEKLLEKFGKDPRAADVKKRLDASK